MTDLPPDLAAALEGLGPRLGRLGGPYRFFSSVASTNDAAAALSEGAVVVADSQTAGRGRRGHSWFSPPGAGLYVSLVLCPSRSRSDPSRATMLLTLTIGVALAEAIEASEGLRVDLKWPNDLYSGGRKLGGILAEAQSQNVVVGYGINLEPAAYPPALRSRATSLVAELGRPIDRARLTAMTLSSVAARYDDLLEARFDAILESWRGRAPSRAGARVALAGDGGAVAGVTAGIDDHGALLVRVGNRLERIVAGEVTWL